MVRRDEQMVGLLGRNLVARHESSGKMSQSRDLAIAECPLKLLKHGPPGTIRRCVYKMIDLLGGMNFIKFLP
jgi:hypothetical protein